MRARTGSGLAWARVTISLGIAVLLFVWVLQLARFEGRLERLADSVKDLDATVARLSERLQAGGPPPAGSAPAPAPASAGSTDAAPPPAPASAARNLLRPDPFVMVPPEADRDGEITCNLVVAPRGLNMYLERSADVSEIYEYVTDSFARRHWDDPDAWAPLLAESVEISDDYTVYTIRLRKDVKWQAPAVDRSDPRYAWLAGDHYVTADDVTFTFDILTNPQAETASLQTYYKDVESLTVVDPHTVVFRWKKKLFHSLVFTVGFTPIPKFLYAFDEDGTPFPPETIGSEFNAHWYNDRPIGCGAFVFESHERGVALKIRRNEDYYGEKPALRRITFLFVRDPNQRLLKLKSRELDIAELLPAHYRSEILEGPPDSPFRDGRIQHTLYQYLNYIYIGWNLESPLFREKAVRQAMTYACNREGILANVMMGLGTVVNGTFFIQSYAYNHALAPYPFDLARAAEILDGAGWRDADGDGIREKVVDGESRTFAFEFLISAASETQKTIASIYKEDLRKIGVQLNVVPLEWALHIKRVEDRDFDAYFSAWALAWDPDPYQIWHSSQADIPKSSNRIRFRNAEVDALIERGRESFDRAERTRIFHRIGEVLHDEQPYTFFFAQKIPLASWDYVKHVSVRPYRLQVSYHSVWIAPHE